MNDWAAVCRYGGVGDDLIVSSVLKPLREKYGRVEVITQAPQHVVFENNPHVDKLSVHKPGDLPAESLEAWHRWHRIRAKEYAFFQNLSHTVECQMAFLPQQTEFNRPVEWRRARCDMSYIEAVAGVCGVDPAACEPRFYPTAEETAKALATFAKVPRRPIIGWVLSGTRIDKIYPASTLVIARLIHELGAAVVMFGGPGRDREMAVRIQDHVQRQNGSLEGLHGCCDEKAENQEWPIRRVLSTLPLCDLVITPDTGPGWAVAYEPVPKIVLLSHASVRNISGGWRNAVTLHADPALVPCWPCHQLHDALDTCTPDATGQAAACISSISPSLIVTTAAKLLMGTKAYDLSAAASQDDGRSVATDRGNGHDGSEGAQDRPGGLQSGGRGNGGDPAHGGAACVPPPARRRAPRSPRRGENGSLDPRA